MTNYFRVTAYHTKQDISVILDSNGRFEKLWQFSSFLVNKGFKIIEVTTSDKLVYNPFPLIEEESNKILLRSIAKGLPMIQEITYQDRPCKAICVGENTYGQFIM